MRKKSGLALLGLAWFGYCCVSLSCISLPAKDQVASEISSVIGKSVYAAGFSRLYEVGTTMEAMQPPSITSKQYLTGWTAMDEYCRTRVCRARRIPLLVPLKITDARYDVTHKVVVLTLRLPNGSEALSLTTAGMLAEGTDHDDVLRRICGLLLTDIPNDLSSAEILAVKSREIFIGIRKAAVYDMLGLPTAEANGGRELLYADSLVILLDAEERVVGVRSSGLASEYLPEAGDASLRPLEVGFSLGVIDSANDLSNLGI